MKRTIALAAILTLGLAALIAYPHHPIEGSIFLPTTQTVYKWVDPCHVTHLIPAGIGGYGILWHC